MRVCWRLAFVLAVIFVDVGLGQKPKPSFSTTISAPQSVVKAGSDVVLEITKTNTSKQDIRVGWMLGEDLLEVDYWIDVLDVDGNQAEETELGEKFMERVR